jgi:hypothetical protein
MLTLVDPTNACNKPMGCSIMRWVESCTPSMNTHANACIHAYTHAHMHTYMHTYMHTHMHKYMHTYIHSNWRINTDIHIYTHTVTRIRVTVPLNRNVVVAFRDDNRAVSRVWIAMIHSKVHLRGTHLVHLHTGVTINLRAFGPRSHVHRRLLLHSNLSLCLSLSLSLSLSLYHC